MTDYSRDRLGPDDEDRLPWLEPVEEELEEERGISSRMIIFLVAGLLTVAIVIGGFFWMRSRDDGGSGEGGLITAPDAYYKERPAADAADNGEDEIVYSASKGNEVESVIDTSGTAETPVNVDRQQQAADVSVTPGPTVVRNAPVATPKPTAPPAPVKPAAKPAAPSSAPTGGSGTIQLGAFSSQAKANAAWKNLSGRFTFLSGLTQSVVSVQSGDKTLYRLRASGGDARDICGRLRTAGESCSVIG